MWLCFRSRTKRAHCCVKACTVGGVGPVTLYTHTEVALHRSAETTYAAYSGSAVFQTPRAPPARQQVPHGQSAVGVESPGWRRKPLTASKDSHPKTLAASLPHTQRLEVRLVFKIQRNTRCPALFQQLSWCASRPFFSKRPRQTPGHARWVLVRVEIRPRRVAGW